MVLWGLRALLGSVLLAAGVLKALEPPAVLADIVTQYELVPPALAGPISILLPVAEVILGATLLLGIRLREAA